MTLQVYAGLTSQTVDVFLGDSSSTTGAGLTGLVYNTSGLKCYYRKGATGTATAITLATQTVGGAWSSGGFVEIDATNMPGIYRLDLPNAAVDTAGFVTLYFSGAANLMATPQRVDCRALVANVKLFGDTAGTFSGGRPEVNTTHWSGTAVGSVTINCNMTQISGDSVAADNAESFFDGTGYAGTNNVIPTVSTVTNGVTVTTNNDKTGYSLASGGLSAISTWTVAITGNITGNLSGSVASVTGRVTANTDQWNGVTVTGMPMPTYTQPTGFLAATFPSDPADQSAVEAAITAATTSLATAASQTAILDRQAYTLAVLAGACSDPQTASETYVLTIGGSTYTVDMAGQTSTGTRTAPTLTKT